MRIVFMGSPDFAIPSLEKLHASTHEIAAVVSNIDKRRGRGGGTGPTPVKAKAEELGLRVIEAKDLSEPSLEDQLRKMDADLFAVVGFRVLPNRLLEIPEIGSVNLHASLLPSYRGAAPIHRAVMAGEKKTGVSVFFLEPEVDTGAVIKQRETPIGPDETTGDVYDRLKEMGGDLLLEAVDEIEAGSYKVSPQDHTLATPAPKLFSDECKVDFNSPATVVHNKIRGLSPYPGAWAELDDRRFLMFRSELGPDDAGLNPGHVAITGGEMLVGCADGSVVMKEVQIEGKRRMSGTEFMNGYNGAGVLH